MGRREEDRDPEGGDKKVQSAVFPERGWGAERECLHFSWLPSGGARRAGNQPTPQMFTMPLGHRFGIGGGAVPETGIGCSRPGSESSERSHGMIKGKWRIDLGGKIKGAKSVALGSAVTKRGQDNSLQMCERCKYQTGGGEAARRARGAGTRAGQARRGAWGPLGDCREGWPLSIQWRCGGRGNGVLGSPRFQTGVPFLGCSSASLVLTSTSHSRPAEDLRSRVQIPSESVCAPGPQGLSRCSRARRLPPRNRLLGPPPRRPGSRPFGPPRARRAAGGGVSLRGGSLWRCCVRRSLCRGAGSRGNANEANPGRRAEAPGGDGREGSRAR